MRIIVTAYSPELDSAVDPRFGRAAYFLAADPETMAWEAHPNPAVNAAGGAGSQAAQFVTRLQGTAVISGAFGPNAFQALSAAGVEMYLCAAGLSARQAVEAFRAGSLERASAASRPGRRG
jgi:predicted Fe-Mo cluster-binding NifX family protein